MIQAKEIRLELFRADIYGAASSVVYEVRYTGPIDLEWQQDNLVIVAADPGGEVGVRRIFTYRRHLVRGILVLQ